MLRAAVFYASTFSRSGGESTVRPSAMLRECKPLDELTKYYVQDT